MGDWRGFEGGFGGCDGLRWVGVVVGFAVVGCDCGFAFGCCGTTAVMSMGVEGGVVGSAVAGAGAGCRCGCVFWCFGATAVVSMEVHGRSSG